MIDESLVAVLGFLTAALSIYDAITMAQQHRPNRLLRIQRILAGATYLGVAVFWITRELASPEQVFSASGGMWVRVLVCCLCLVGAAEIITRWESKPR